MRIEHVAIWVEDIDGMRKFYEHYFEAEISGLYENPKNQFKSYFLTFQDKTRLEIMQQTSVTQRVAGKHLGWAHLAFAVGNRVNVDELTRRLIEDGFVCQSGPRITGDGYYESVIEDPEGNLIEITE